MAARCKYGRQQDFYVLQCDIQKYFQNIDWDILLSIISKVIHCKRTLNLIKKIIVTHESTSNSSILSQTQTQLDLFSHVQIEVPPVRIAERKGLPIGNLTSQLFANVYLNELDHFVKERLKERWYARYMDDFLIIHPDKNHLINARDRIAEYLSQTLKLRLHPRKITIKNVQEGVPFVGYRIFFDHTLVRGDTLRHMQRKYRYKTKMHKEGKISDLTLAQSQTSIQGHLKHANAHGLYAFMTNNRV